MMRIVMWVLRLLGLASKPPSAADIEVERLRRERENRIGSRMPNKYPTSEFDED